MKKLILVVCIVLLASTAYAQKLRMPDGETVDEAFANMQREARQNEFEQEQLRMERAREAREEELARSQLRLNMMMEERLSQPQQYQIRRNGNTLVIEEY